MVYKHDPSDPRFIETPLHNINPALKLVLLRMLSNCFACFASNIGAWNEEYGLPILSRLVARLPSIVLLRDRRGSYLF